MDFVDGPPQRNSIRLREYDYRAAGAYFVTICAHEKAEVFGDVAEGEVLLSAAGVVVKTVWDEMPVHFPHAALDAFVVMPNHVHMIVYIVETVGAQHAAPAVGLMQHKHSLAAEMLPRDRAQHAAPLRGDVNPHGVVRPGSLGAIIRSFKSACTKRINEIRDSPGTPIWQRNYYERVIRNEAELNAIREYIINNPARWQEDEENPNHHP